MLVLKRVAHAFGLKAHAMQLGSNVQCKRLVSPKKQELLGLDTRIESE